MPKGNHSNHAKGGQHYRWNAGRILSQHGYVRIRVGVSHPLADRNGYAYEHLLVVMASNSPGAYLLGKYPEKYVIHHVNGDRSDNRIENMQVIERAEHNALHNSERGRDAMGRFLPKQIKLDEYPGGGQ